MVVAEELLAWVLSGRNRVETYKSFSMSAASTLGARERVFMRNCPRADEGSASSSRTLLT